MEKNKFVTNIVNELVKNPVIAEHLGIIPGVKLIFDDLSPKSSVLGYFYVDPKTRKKSVTICVRGVADLVDNTNEDDVLTIIACVKNVIAHEYRHARQFNMMCDTYGKKKGFKLWKNFITAYKYDIDPFEQDAFKYAAMVAYSEQGGNESYSTEEEAALVLLSLITETIFGVHGEVKPMQFSECLCVSVDRVSNLTESCQYYNTS